MARPLKIPLGIDFSKFDRDLRGIADKIEGVGRAASISVGGNIGQMGAGSLDTAALGQAVAQVGTQLSMGIANGIRAASASMMGFVGHIDVMFNRLAGTAITMFQRIDSAMKFPRFDAFFTSSKMKLSRWVTFWKKPLTDIDKAMGGVFGDKIAVLTRVLKALFEDLAASISSSMTAALANVTAQFALMNAGAQKVDASADAMLSKLQGASKAGAKTGSIGEGPKAPASGPLASIKGAMAGMQKTFGPAIKYGARVFRELGDAAVGTGMIVRGAMSVIPAAIFQVISPVRSVIGFFRNLSGSADVTKKSFDDIYGSAQKTGGVLGRLAGLVTAPFRAMGSVLMAPFKALGGVAAAPFKTITAGAETAKAATGGLGASFVTLGGQVLAALGVFGLLYKAVDFIKAGVMAASDFNEAASKGQTIFGNAFGSVSAQAEAMNAQFRISRTEMIDTAAGFGAMAQGAGMSEQASADLANQMTKMTADLSSSVNEPFKEMGMSIRAALSGEAEPLRRFGVNMIDANVQAFALKTGMVKSAKSMTDQQKIAARAALIMQGLKYAVGDLEKTQSGAANQFRKAGGGIQEFALRIGQLLLPSITAGTVAFNEFLATFLDVFEAAVPYLQAFGGVAASAFGKVTSAVGTLVTTAMPYVQAFAAMVPNAFQVISDLGQVVFGTLFSAVIGFWGPVISDWQGSLAALWSGVASILGAVGVDTMTLGATVGAAFGWMTTELQSWGKFFGDTFGGVGLLIRNFGTFFQIAQLQAGAFILNTIGYIQTLPANFGIVFDWIKKNWKTLWRDLIMVQISFFTNMGKNAASFGVALWEAIQGKGFNFSWTPMLDGFKATTEKLPEMIKPALVSVDAAVAQLMNKVTTDENARVVALAQSRANVAAVTTNAFAMAANPLAGGLQAAALAANATAAAMGKAKATIAESAAAAGQFAMAINPLGGGLLGAAASAASAAQQMGAKITKPAVPEEVVPKGEYKLASVAEVGSKEAASILARAMTPGAQQDKTSQQLGVAKDSNATLKKIEAKMTAPVQLAVK